MRKAVIIIFIVILLAGLSGCQVIIPSFVDINGSANDAVNQANASNIATAYNAFRALHPDDDIGMEKSDFKGPEELHEAIGDSLWPEGLKADNADEAWPLLTITGGVASVLPLER